MKVIELAIYVVRVRCYCPHSIIPNCVWNYYETR